MSEESSPELEESIPPTPAALDEALSLSEEIIQDIELSRVALHTAALKTSRLARLLNHFDYQRIFQLEASGYPSTPDGVEPKVWRLLEIAGRVQQQRDSKTQELKSISMLASVEQMENEVDAAKLGLQAAQDRDVSISSANPQQFVFSPQGNILERTGLRSRISENTKQLSGRRAFIYDYSSRRYYELKYSRSAYDIFSAVRSSVDRNVGDVIPDAVQKFTSVHDNLRSENLEDWSNAVHSCRRILQDLADAVFPIQLEPRVTQDRKQINLGPNNYINRLVCFAEDNSLSARSSDLIGSHLEFLGDRLDAAFLAAQKGSHAVVSAEEANRFVVYTYMLVGDLLALWRASHTDSTEQAGAV